MLVHSLQFRAPARAGSHAGPTAHCYSSATPLYTVAAKAIAITLRAGKAVKMLALCHAHQPVVPAASRANWL
ncbi:hypothetical protein LEMLEM_LOCUS26142 [Lemmus lemmus]